MRNTHFGSDGSGFGGPTKFKGTAALVAAATSGAAFEQLTLDSDRNIVSRKRGGKLAAAPPDSDNNVRDSQ
jgi:hypothetical protein